MRANRTLDNLRYLSLDEFVSEAYPIRNSDNINDDDSLNPISKE